MPVKNLKGLLVQGAAYPAAIETRLPPEAPKVSTALLDTAGKVPTVPDFPVEIPDLPTPPELPSVPGATAARAVESTPTPKREALVGGGKIIEGRGF